MRHKSAPHLLTDAGGGNSWGAASAPLCVWSRYPDRFHPELCANGSDKDSAPPYHVAAPPSALLHSLIGRRAQRPELSDVCSHHGTSRIGGGGR